MNIHALHQKEIAGPETMNWTPVEVPVEETAEEAATQVLKGMMVQYLLRHAYRVGKIGMSTMFFLTLGATGLWAVVDLVKIAIDSFEDK